MSSRENILNRIRDLKLEPTALPGIPHFESGHDLLALFKAASKANHVEVIEATQDELNNTLTPLLQDYHHIYSCMDEVPASTLSAVDLQSHERMGSLEAVIVKGEMGVAENAAIWIPEANVKERVLTFITLHLFVVLSKENLLGNMHETYAKISDIPGFGVFVAGPSKTADIEQSLVIGAHGPKKMTVVLV